MYIYIYSPLESWPVRIFESSCAGAQDKISDSDMISLPFVISPIYVCVYIFTYVYRRTSTIQIYAFIYIEV
jgi:hypothetical protein